MHENEYQVIGRVKYLYPGKHGPDDLKVEFCGNAPTLAEQAAMVWGLAKAEDRYNKSGQQGRWMFKRLLDELFDAPTLAEALPVLERISNSVERKQAA